MPTCFSAFARCQMSHAGIVAEDVQVWREGQTRKLMPRPSPHHQPQDLRPLTPVEVSEVGQGLFGLFVWDCGLSCSDQNNINNNNENKVGTGKGWVN